ncbi:hypothetical protein [Absidia glauca]|uniref:Galactose oxidase n=1 Tax=Absidia glauca TaxID=4829 RepID=A0A163JWF4_ABSGL|nr:hypothetical protein [Absidia glauca]
MGQPNHFLFVGFLLFLSQCVRSDSLPSVYKHGCVLLGNQRIYCHGGASRSSPTTKASDTYFNDDVLYNQHVYLDVSKPLNLSSANNQWQPVATTSFTLEPRADFAIVSHNATSFIVSGGIGAKTTPGDQSLAHISIRYNAELNLWSDIKSQNASAPKFNFTFDTQLFGGRAIKISDQEYMINGGIPPNNNTVLFPNTSYVDVEATGPNWSSMQAWTIPISRGGQVFPERSRSFRVASALSRNGVVYFFGGLLPLNATDNYNYKDNMGYYGFDSLLTFYPLKNQTFDAIKPSNPDFAPAERQLHTVNAVPNTDLILMYGGVTDKGASPDFCWSYETTSGLWRTVNFTNGDGAGPRFGHQTVMVGNDSLYIIGGIDGSGVTQKDVHILNITSMTWLNGSATNTYDQTIDAASSSASSSSSSLSGGAIAGIVIGTVAAVALLIAAAVIIRIQRKKKSLLDSGPAPEGFTSSSVPPMMSSAKEYNMDPNSYPPASPTSDGSTTVYSPKPFDGSFDPIHSSNPKPHMY